MSYCLLLFLLLMFPTLSTLSCLKNLDVLLITLERAGGGGEGRDTKEKEK